MVSVLLAWFGYQNALLDIGSFRMPSFIPLAVYTGIVPVAGVLIGIGLMVYSYFWRPLGVMKKRAPLTEVVVAARGAALPLVIPVIIMGGILTGWFTPTEAGMVACAYILLVLIPVLRPDHIHELPRDFMYAGLLYSLPR